jgi:[acyl-carrier-protein] S-malonyltransferase
MNIAYVFPGQGAQSVGMGLDLYEVSSAAREVFDIADAAVGFPLSRLCFEGPADELTQTINVQPAIVCVSLALLAAARENGLPEPVMLAGHSLGEYTALAAAGAIGTAEVITLARERGRLMHEASLAQPGAMLALLGADPDQALALAEACGVVVANYNCPGQIVISGTREGIDLAQQKAREFGAARAIPLAVSGAFHSPLMQPAIDGMQTVLETVAFADPAYPVITNTGAGPLTLAAEIKDELLRQLRQSVRWQDTVNYMLGQGVDTFVEIGPGKVLSGLIRKTGPDAVTINIGNAAQVAEGVENGS